MPFPADPAAMPEHRRWRTWLGDLALMVIIVLLTIAPIPDDEKSPSNVVGFLIVLAPALYMPLRRRWPVPILALTLINEAIVSALGFLALGVGLSIAVAMFGVANRSRDRRITLLAAIVAVIVIFTFRLADASGDLFNSGAVQSALTVALFAAGGDATRSRREYIRSITDRAIRAEQTRESEAQRRVAEERLRIARDLHDAVAHQISVISLNAGVASSALDSRPEKTREALATIRSASRTVLGEIGDLLAMLRAEEGAFDGSREAPQAGLDRLDELVESFKISGLSVAVRVDGEIIGLPVVTDLVAYRVIQEALTNALKHGAEQRAHLLIETNENDVRIVVTNPVDPAGARSSAVPSGHGLVGLRERVLSVRGSVETGIVLEATGWPPCCR